ncbi:MAG: hypothetical protein JXJ04_08910 [Spirochaetales bacterium]|nr:hypothetical protein [Spirochaetales bacterium]
MDQDKNTRKEYRRCKLKKFPQSFTFRGKTYTIEEKHKKYLKMPINPIFIVLDDHLTPIPVDTYANVIKMNNRKQQMMFSKMISKMHAKDKENRTLVVSA